MCKCLYVINSECRDTPSITLCNRVTIWSLFTSSIGIDETPQHLLHDLYYTVHQYIIKGRICRDQIVTRLHSVMRGVSLHSLIMKYRHLYNTDICTLLCTPVSELTYCAFSTIPICPLEFCLHSFFTCFQQMTNFRALVSLKLLILLICRLDAETRTDKHTTLAAHARRGLIRTGATHSKFKGHICLHRDIVLRGYISNNNRAWFFILSYMCLLKFIRTLWTCL